MFLQTYLYHHCLAIEQSSCCDHNVLFMGVAQLDKLCKGWLKYFSPVVLRGVFSSTDRSRPAPKESGLFLVKEVEDCVTLIHQRCDELFQVSRCGSANAMSWRLDNLRRLLGDTALPLFGTHRYNRPGDGEVPCLVPNDVFLGSFSSLEVLSFPNAIPAIYSDGERHVIEEYLYAIRRAPTLLAAVGLGSGHNHVEYKWVGYGDLCQKFPLSPLETQMADDVEFGTATAMVTICNSWWREAAHFYNTST